MFARKIGGVAAIAERRENTSHCHNADALMEHLTVLLGHASLCFRTYVLWHRYHYDFILYKEILILSENF
jgi:hypothetical protein